MLAAVLSSPGHYEPLGIDTVELNPESLQVPQLILAGSADKVSGTARPYLYFRKYFDRDAPSAFVVQNKSPHCCTANARYLILKWLEAVLKQRQRSESTTLGEIDQRVGWLAFFKTHQTETTDSFGLTTFEVTAATIEKFEFKKSVGAEWKSAGWLPNRAVAQGMARFRTTKPTSDLAPYLIRIESQFTMTNLLLNRTLGEQLGDG